MEFDIVDQRVDESKHKYLLYKLGNVIKHRSDVFMVCNTNDTVNYFLLDLKTSRASKFFGSTHELADAYYSDTDAEVEDLNLNGVIND